MIRLYVPHLADERIHTQYGFITCRDWMEREKQRIGTDKERKAEVVTKGNTVSLLVNEVKGCHCEACVRVYGKPEGEA